MEEDDRKKKRKIRIKILPVCHKLQIIISVCHTPHTVAIYKLYLPPPQKQKKIELIYVQNRMSVVFPFEWIFFFYWNYRRWELFLRAGKKDLKYKKISDPLYFRFFYLSRNFRNTEKLGIFINFSI